MLALRYLLIVASAHLIAVAETSAQNQIKLDSLQLQFERAYNDTAKTKALLEISKEYLKFNYARALDYADKAKETALQSGSDKFIGQSYHNLAAVFLGAGDYKNASSNYFTALKYYEHEKDTVGILSMVINLGVVYDRLAEYDKALSYYLRAQSAIMELKRKPARIESMMPTLYNNIANIYQTKDSVQSALQYYESALKLAEEKDDKRLQGIVLNNLGKLNLNELKQYDKALEYLQRGLRLRLEAGDKAEISKSHNLLANYFIETKNFPEARKEANEALRLGTEVGSLELRKFAYLTLSDLETALGDYKSSLDAFQSYKNLSDSIQNQLASSEITRLQLQYDFEKEEQIRNQEKNETRFRYTLIIVILSAGLLLAILIAVVIRSKARQSDLERKSLTQDMDIKNKELTTNVMYLIRKNELINNVAERLLKLQPGILPENQKTIHDIILELQKEADNDTWKEFELRFNQVHSNFYQTLRKQFPDLSPAEEKLCAFLRLNMSSKEIAAITQQSVKSVEVARARLRKKLNLTNTTSNLVTYLSNL